MLTGLDFRAKLVGEIRRPRIFSRSGKKSEAIFRTPKIAKIFCKFSEFAFVCKFSENLQNFGDFWGPKILQNF